MTQAKITEFARCQPESYVRGLKLTQWAGKHRIEMYWRKRDLEEEPL